MYNFKEQQVINSLIELGWATPEQNKALREALEFIFSYRNNKTEGGDILLPPWAMDRIKTPLQSALDEVSKMGEVVELKGDE